MNSISQIISSKLGSEGSWKVPFSISWICWSYYWLKFLNGIIWYKLHSSYHITLHELGKIWKEGLSFVVFIEFIRLLGFGESAHFKFWQFETVFTYCINYFSCLNVTVWLNKGKRSFGFLFKGFFSKDICIIGQFELSRKYIYYRPNKKFLLRETLASHSLHEYSFVFQIILIKKELRIK